MSPLEYIGESLSDWPLYALLLALFLGLHWPMARRWVVGLFDPLLLVFLTNVLGWTIVWFMYLRDDIEGRYVLSFTAAQLAFYAGIWAGQPARTRPLPVQPVDPDLVVPRITLTTSALIHITCTLTIWAIAGVPLFRPSRLGAFEGSGGLGILERLADSCSVFAVFSLVYLLVRRRGRRQPLVIAFMAWYFVAMAFSGSKGALLTLWQYILSILMVYTGLRHQKDAFWGGRAGKVVLIASMVFAMGVLAAQQQEADWASVAVAFAFRVVSAGDVYIHAYPDATIEQLKGDSAWIGLFAGFLSTFRLYPQTSIYPNIGFQFTGIVFPDLDIIAGPNPLHAVFGYHYFGMFGFIFSFVLGLLTVRAQRLFFHRAHTTFLGGLAAAVLYFTVVSVSIDFEWTLSKLASMIIGGTVAVILPLLLLRPSAAIARPNRRATPPAGSTLIA